MEIQKIRLIYFSPTGTTQKVVESIAKGILVEGAEHINLTLPKNIQQTIATRSDELAIIGAPVYGGRLPVHAIERFKQIKATNTLAVLIVTYGNRAFEDALLELKNLAVELGFIPIAGGAFIGEHSFATKKVPIANGRPDGPDVQTAIDFGSKIKIKVEALKTPDAQTDLAIPGRFPYESAGARPLTVSPVTRADLCTTCGTCGDVCPTGAISIDDNVATEIGRCIRCCACIKNCPTGARVMEDDMVKKMADWLNENCSSRKEPQIFGIPL